MSTKGACRRACRLGLAALGLTLGVSFDAAAALPDVCYGPEEQPYLVYEWFGAWYSSSLPLDEKSCEKITKKLVAECHKAVSDASKCQSHMIRSLRSIAKPACEGDDGCVEQRKDDADAQQASLEQRAREADESCDGEDFADSIFQYCVEGQ
jgi:hypothetical protein